MLEKVLALGSGTVLLVAAICCFVAGKLLIASACAFVALCVFSFWRPKQSQEVTQDNTSDNPTPQSDNPTPQEVLEYRKKHPGTSLMQAVRALKS